MAGNSDISDSNLLKGISMNDEKAFKTLFHRYYDRLFRFLFHIVKSREVAEELVMDVFLKMWLARDMVPEIANLDGFLFRVAYHKSIDFFRAAEKDKRLNDAMWKMIHVPAENYADAAMAAQEYEAVLRQAVDLLPPQRKKIFLLHQNEGLTHSQIAQRFGISKNTIANTLVEARQFIKAYLSKHLDLVMVMCVFYLLFKRL